MRDEFRSKGPWPGRGQAGQGQDPSKRGERGRQHLGHGTPHPGPAPHRPQVSPASAAAWDNVAAWYDKLVGDEGSDYHRHVILPAALRLLDVQPGERVLDLCCGQGVFCRLLAQTPAAAIVGVDASRELIAAARARSSGPARPAVPADARRGEGPGGPRVRYVVADARHLPADLAGGTFDAAACLMAVQDVDDVAGLFASLGTALRPGGRAAVVMMHPCFRIPRQSSWGWDEEKKMQFRRLDRYGTPLVIPIATHPGGDTGQYTHFYHRPLAAYLNALGAAGLGVVACEELQSHRTSQPGGHSRGENRAREEFPLFLALKAVKLPGKQQ